VNLLDILLIIPAAGFLLTLLLPRSNENLVRWFTLAVALLEFVVSLGVIGPVLENPTAFTSVTDVLWIHSPAIRYHVGLNGLSIWLVILTTFLTPITMLASWSYIRDRVKEFYAFLLLQTFSVLGVFVAQDLFLFFVMWEVSLVPIYFLIGVWGHDRRIYAAVKFFLFTMAGSALMLLAIIYLYQKSGTFDLTILTDMLAKGQLVFTHGEAVWLFLAFFLAFAIKVPLFPLHTWLPDAHGEAPTAGSIVLASLLLKLGSYAMLRVCLPLFPSAAKELAPFIITLALIAITYGALVAMVQPNMKRLVAYSSVSHMGYVVLGIFTLTALGMDGAVYVMLAHGISTGALFLLVGLLYERRHSLEIADYGGISTAAPWLSAMLIVASLASIGLPLLCNFVGEFLVLQSAMKVNVWYAVFAGLGVILSSVYMLWLVQRVCYGEASEEVREHVTDPNAREWAIIVPLVAVMVWLGIGASSFLQPITASTQGLLQQMKQNSSTQLVEIVKEPVHGQ
jgi:NADH-quinone oxidoreductase subunit M